jgi:sensor histidine kinase YesM
VKKYNSYWSKLSLKRKLLTYFFIISFFGAIINLYLHNNNYKVMDQFNENLTNYYKINELLVLTRNNQTYAEAYLKNLDIEYKHKYQLTKGEINLLIQELDSRFSSLEAHFSINAIKYSVAYYMNKWDNAILLRDNNETKYYVDYYEGIEAHVFTEQYIQDLLYNSLNEGATLYNDLVEDSIFIRSISLGIILVTFLLSLLFGGVFSNYVVAPIKKLVNASIKISEGQLDVDSVEVNSTDEVGILADSFNTMNKSINSLVNDLKQKALIERKLHEEEMELIQTQQLLQEAEFLALQSQINPHFLFNTLNTISRTAMFEKADDTTKLIGALSNIFRFSLQSTGKSISLKEELIMIDEYIYLQRFRFKDRLRYDVKCRVDTSKIYLPVFSLQPLVENAIIHGIEPKIEGGIVRLKIYEKNNTTIIKLIDNGFGMSKEKIQAVLEKDTKKASKSIGLINVYSRFQTFFNHQSSFVIKSRLGFGTIIEMSIPNELRGEKRV